MKNIFNRVVISAVVAYLVVMGFTWFSAKHLADHKTEALLDFAVDNFNMRFAQCVDLMLITVADCAVQQIGLEARKVSQAEVNKLAEIYGLDELNIISRDGEVLVSNDARQNGVNMNDYEAPRQFMILTNGVTQSFSQPFRQGAHNPEARRKFAGVPFLNGNGFLQVGYDESRCAGMLWTAFIPMVETWQIGETGYYICLRSSDHLVDVKPIFHKDIVKKFPTQFGLDLRLFNNVTTDRETVELKLFNEKCSCRRFTLAGHTIIAVLPYAEFYGGMCHGTVARAAAALLLILIVFVCVYMRMKGDAEKITLLRNVEDKRRAEDLATARTIQVSSLPNAFPPYPNLVNSIDLFAAMRTAKEVGGDFYDFYRLDANRLALVIADVSGKGVPAAMFMMRAKTTINSVLSTGGDLVDAVAEANDKLCEGNVTTMFVTAWIGIVDLRNGKISYVNAGHNAPLVRRVNGKVEWLRMKPNIALGAMAGMKFRVNELRLAPGDALFLYTDGVNEATNRDNVFYGDEALYNSFSNATGTAQAVIKQMLKDVNNFTNGAPQADDITMLSFVFIGASAIFHSTPSGLIAAKEFCDELCMSPRVAVVMDEIASNIVRCSHSHEFEVRLVRKGRDIIMTFRDSGDKFNPLELPPPDITKSVEERVPGGLGIFMVRKMARDIKYEYINGQNVLTITVEVSK